MSSEPGGTAAAAGTGGEPVWLSGGTGLIGGRLVPALLDQGRPVHLVSRAPAATTPREGVHLHEWNGTYVPAESLRGCGAAMCSAPWVLSKSWAHWITRRVLVKCS